MVDTNNRDCVDAERGRAAPHAEQVNAASHAEGVNAAPPAERAHAPIHCCEMYSRVIAWCHEVCTFPPLKRDVAKASENITTTQKHEKHTSPRYLSK